MRGPSRPSDPPVTIALNEPRHFSSVTRSERRTRPSTAASITSPTPWLDGRRAAASPVRPASSPPITRGAPARREGSARIAPTALEAPVSAR
jgi:hypothetical protein